MATSATTIETLASDFEEARARLAGRNATWLEALRADAMQSLADLGLPSVRDEDWKYTNVQPALRERLEPVLPAEARADAAGAAPLLGRAAGIAADAPMLVFVNGSFEASLSRVEPRRGVSVASLRERLEREPGSLEPWLGKYIPARAHGFTALNTAFLDDGAVVEIAEGAAVEEPVHLVFLSTARERAFATHPRNLIVAGAGSRAQVVEHYVGVDGARHLTNTATEIVVGRGATLGHLRVQDEAQTAFHVARVQVEQHAGSSLVSHAFGVGAALSRTEIAVRLAGEEAECNLAGLYAVDGSRHVDHHLMIDHAAPRTRSNQLYKGVLEDDSRGVFTGRVVVRSGSQKIRAMQSNPSLLLGRGAVAETRPQLEIYADDVACNHGATIGRLDEDALFYLMTRGIDPRESRRILVSGFVGEVVDTVAGEKLRDALREFVGARVGTLGRRTRGATS